jgi:hypothetical protein
MLPAFPVYPGNQKKRFLGAHCSAQSNRAEVGNPEIKLLTTVIVFCSPRQKNTGQNGGKPRLDLNVEAAWAQGVTGKNVTTAIMDDGKWPPNSHS